MNERGLGKREEKLSSTIGSANTQPSSFISIINKIIISILT
jgi:hypothetical protein